jgi:cytochrome c biogenesis protein ResB
MNRIASWTFHFIFLLVGLFVGVFIICSFLKRTEPLYQPSFGVVDTQALVQFEAEKLAKESPQEVLSDEKLEHIAERLKQKVKLFAYFNKVVVLAKGAVWGGNLPDYTEMILEDVKEVDHASQFE